MTVRVTIDAETRSLLVGELQMPSTTSGLTSAIADLDRDRAQHVIEAACRTVRMLDDLDWSATSPGGAELVCHLDHDLWWPFLYDVREKLEGDIGHDVVELERQRRGDEDHYYLRQTQEESIRTSLDRIERSTVDVERITGLMQQFVDARTEAVA